MKKNILLLFGFVYFTISVVIIRSDVGDIITSPSPKHPAVKNTFDYYGYGLTFNQVPGAVWIWDTNWNNTLTPSPITVTEDFYATCKSIMTVYATADDQFTITLNGNTNFLSGTDWRGVRSADFSPQCGRNNFSITAYNTGPPSQINPAGLIYGIIQDTKSCYDCPEGQVWNPKTCSCQCASHCDCRKDQDFKGLPSCQCACAASNKQCDKKAYWDENTCSCLCLPQICRIGWIFSQDICECKKRCIQIQDCPPGFEWNWTSCRCIRKKPSGVGI